MTTIPYLMEVLREIAYDNGMVHRDTTEGAETNEMLERLRSKYLPSEIRALDITLGGLSAEDRKAIAVDPEAPISIEFKAQYAPFDEMLDFAFDGPEEGDAA